MKAKGSTKTKGVLHVALICSILALLASELYAQLDATVPSGICQSDSATPPHGGSPPGQNAACHRRDNRFIVRDIDGVLGINGTCAVLGCQVVESMEDPNGQVFVIQNIGPLDPNTFQGQLVSAAGVVDAEADQIVNTLGATVQRIPDYLTDDTPIEYYGAVVWEGYVLQTPNQIVHTAQTQADFGVTGAGVTVAVIDTGADPNNTVLNSVLVSGYDFTRNASGGSELADISQSTAGVIDGSKQAARLSQSTAGVIDQSTAGVIDTPRYAAFGHGTMTAGIVHLVAPQAAIMPLKAFTADGTAYASDVLRAIYYAVNNGANVISMSFEFSSASPELAAAINHATKRGLICVASAGNDASMATVYPASLPNVIDVASTSNTNAPSNFSNYGAPPVWISAPGEGVMTTYPFNTYAAGWGTSFSAPFVSGTVALMASISARLTKTTAADALSHAQPVSNLQYGYGVLDTDQAVQAWMNWLASIDSNHDGRAQHVNKGQKAQPLVLSR